MDKLVPRGHYLVSFISPLMNEGGIFEIIYLSCPSPPYFKSVSKISPLSIHSINVFQPISSFYSLNSVIV